MDWTSGLNSSQGDAVRHNEGPLLILAGAGSGKTTVLVARTGRLLDEGIVPPEKLCVLTFTNKAARELKHRVSTRLGPRAKKIWAGTFHSFGLQLLRKHYKKARLPKEFGIMDSSDGNGVIKELLGSFHQNEKTAYDPERIHALLSEWRGNERPPKVGDDEYEVAAEWVLPKYLKQLERLGMVDFDGLILKPLELIQQDAEVREAIREQYQYIMVDEFQDTNDMQMRLIKALSEPLNNLAVVGDDDQSIYGWRGARVSNILDFPKRYENCKVVRLEDNYRSTPAILNLANHVISKNTQRHHKTLRASGHLAGEVGMTPELFTYPTENDEAESIVSETAHLLSQGRRRDEIAILYRSNSQGALLEAELRKSQIPYRMSGGTAFFDRREIRDVLAYLRCSIRPNEVAFRRIINTPARGIGEKTIDDLTEYSEARHLPFLETARRWTDTQIDPKAGHAIDQLFVFLEGLQDFIVTPDAMPPGARMLQKLEEVSYKQHLEKTSPDKLIAGKRWKFIELFSGILDKFVAQSTDPRAAFKEFVECMELRDIPEDTEKAKDNLQLMTLHACKGLEFPIVFLCGVEEDILPHKTLGSDVSEERRLFYVGITRARERLILTRAEKRKRHGRLADCVPSRFIVDVPENLVVKHSGPRPVREERRKSLLDDLFKKLDSLDAQAGQPKNVNVTENKTNETVRKPDSP